jgi:hypothetical protein
VSLYLNMFVGLGLVQNVGFSFFHSFYKSSSFTAFSQNYFCYHAMMNLNDIWCEIKDWIHLTLVCSDRLWLALAVVQLLGSEEEHYFS